jgi:hypothetical protein
MGIAPGPEKPEAFDSNAHLTNNKLYSPLQPETNF